MDHSYILRHLGASANYKGYHYLLTALRMIENDPDLIFAITKQVYPQVALQHHTNWQDVERCIRSLIRHMWKSERRLVCCLMGRPLEKCPTNSTFIAAMITLPKLFDEPSINYQIFMAKLFWDASFFSFPSDAAPGRPEIFSPWDAQGTPNM